MKNMTPTLLLAIALSANASAAGSQQVFTPESIIPAGLDQTIVVNPYTGQSGEARKGTVAAVINNIALLNKLLIKPQSESDSKNIQAIINEIDSLIPSLNVIGLFDFFSVNEWLADDKTQPGRALTAALYLKQYPSKMDATTQKMLGDLYQNTTIIPLKEAVSEIK